MHPKEAIDVEELLERIGGDKKFFKELLVLFANDFKRKRQRLKKALAKRDYEQIKEMAHSLHGACANISAKPLQIDFSQLEERASHSDLQNIQDWWDKIEEDFNAFLQCFKALKADLK